MNIDLKHSSNRPIGNRPSLKSVVQAYAVHLYTASGLIWAFLALNAIFSDQYQMAFLWLTVAVGVDATDGFLARKVRVKSVLPRIDGRKMDDIVDYLNYTFIPILMLCHAQLLPNPVWLWASVPLIASLFLFCSEEAKEEAEGFFGGFPSYWNIYAFYVVVWLKDYGPMANLTLILFLSLLSLMPVRFVYPTLAPRWRHFFIFGGIVWAVIILLMLAQFQSISPWLLHLSLVYPFLYIVLSVYLDWVSRRATKLAVRS